jgi:flagellar biogenesis protein FliO
MFEQNLVGSLLGIIAVLALLFLFLYALRWLKPRYLYGEKYHNPKMIMEAELQLGMRQRLVLIKTDDRHLIVALGNDSIQLIDSWVRPDSGVEADYGIRKKIESDTK